MRRQCTRCRQQISQHPHLTGLWAPHTPSRKPNHVTSSDHTHSTCFQIRPVLTPFITPLVAMLKPNHVNSFKRCGEF